ncbi:hypothetical protein [Tessaracoccus sp. O5.2]|uniref:hypothetical protein n=1 Tax=Tessaracoccus sp. O5.2 TaxID=3157622 RepID=UPI0036DD10E5
MPWTGLGCECGCYSCWGWGIDAFGVGFETRPDGYAVGRDLSERGGVGFETRPDGSAVGRDLSDRVARPQ